MQGRTRIATHILLWTLAFVGVQLVLAAPHGVLEGRLIGPDSYMRLNRVVHLESGGAWLDANYPRINPPLGHEQHWTRPMDLLLWAPAKALAPQLGFAPALHVAAIWINVVLLALSLAVLLRCAARFALTHPEAVPILGMTFVLQTATHGVFQLGRPDHQGLLFLFNAVSATAVVRSLLEPDRARPAIVAGIAAALALWVSIESMLIVAVACATWALLWMVEGRRVRPALLYASSLTLALALCLLVEKGAGAFTSAAVDQISVPFVTLFALMTLGWLLVERLSALPASGGSAWRRGVAGVAVALAALLLYLALHGAALVDPLSEVDSLYERVRLRHIEEYKSLLTLARDSDMSAHLTVASLLGYIGLPLIALLYCAGSLRREGRIDGSRLYFLLGTLLFVVFTFRQAHWVAYALLFGSVPYALFASRAIARLHRDGGSALDSLSNVLVLVLLVGWPILVMLSSVPGERASGDAVTLAEEAQARSCDLRPVAAFLETRPSTADERLLAFVDHGPELLYRSEASVFSIPNHREQPGFTASYAAMSAASDAESRAVLERLGADALLLCEGALEDSFYSAEGHEDTLHRRLTGGAVPSWLVPVELPASVPAEFRLFATDFTVPETSR